MKAVAGMAVLLAVCGCSALPDIVHQPQYHNPFPQLYKVAVLPFYNQSAHPTLNQDDVALAYYTELQQIPGFEVMPVGVAKRILEGARFEPQKPEDFQKLAQLMGVDAVIVGAVTEYTPYYPPRLGLSVDWYAANPCFHPIPVGYGLPWGRAEEEFIPDALVREAEFELAREQLKTQTPRPEPAVAGDETPRPEWPDPRGFVPPPPSLERPECEPHLGPIITHTRLYDGHDSDFTERLASYFYFRDDARFGGWQAYLQRSEDFIRFCCYLHITETLAARGGAGETRVVWRWPIGRYER